jgi:hypothetical protein
MLTSVACQEQQPIADYIDILADFIKNIFKNRSLWPLLSSAGCHTRLDHPVGQLVAGRDSKGTLWPSFEANKLIYAFYKSQCQHKIQEGV